MSEKWARRRLNLIQAVIGASMLTLFFLHLYNSLPTCSPAEAIYNDKVKTERLVEHQHIPALDCVTEQQRYHWSDIASGRVTFGSPAYIGSVLGVILALLVAGRWTVKLLVSLAHAVTEELEGLISLIAEVRKARQRN